MLYFMASVRDIQLYFLPYKCRKSVFYPRVLAMCKCARYAYLMCFARARRVVRARIDMEWQNLPYVNCGVLTLTK